MKAESRRQGVGDAIGDNLAGSDLLLYLYRKKSFFLSDPQVL